MLTVQEHLAVAEKNEQFAETLATLSQRVPEWEVTVLFYSALHYASAFLASQGHNPQNHIRRNILVGNLTGVGSDYQNLYAWSQDTRYRGKEFTIHQADSIKTGPFRRLKEEVLSLLGNLPRIPPGL